MIRSYLKFAIRHFRKNLSFSLINLFGLSFGLAAAFAVVLYVQDELSYEAFHDKAENIVRLNLEASFDGNVLKLGTAPNKAAPFLKERLPEIREALRVFPHNYGESASIRVDNQNFAEQNVFWADSNLMEVFTIDLLPGAQKNPISRTNTIMLSESTAKKYFPYKDPVGETIRLDDKLDLEITAVFKDLPANTHLPMDLIGSFITDRWGKPDNMNWGNASFYTYFLLNPGTDIQKLENKVTEVVKKEVPEERQWFAFRLKPLLDIHLYSSDMMTENESYGSITQVWVLISLALVLLLIACINYMNLATAKSQQRSKEVAINKTVGATFPQMVRQFYTETALLSLAGIVLSLLILRLLLPNFNNIADKELSIYTLLQPPFVFGLLGIWLFITLVAGSYPAIYLASFSPMSVLRQNKESRFGAAFIRKGLVVFQFCISTILIVGTIILYQQLNFIRNKKLGFNPEQVVALRVMGIQPRQSIETLQQELLQLPSVSSASLSQSYPGHSASGRSLSLPEAPEGQAADLTSCRAHPKVFEVLDLDLIAGRPMRIPEEGDTITEIVLNRAAIEYLGFSPEEALGRKVNANLGTSEIVGVSEDFHYGPLHQKIGFYAFHNRKSEWLQYLLIKLNTSDLMRTMEQLQGTFKRVAPNTAFEYTFLDEKLDALYRSEKKLASVVFIFAGLAIFIACLGLFALAAFATERRTKEIGIRKVLGATVTNIIALLSKEFLQLVALSFLIAIPIAWYAMSRWLQDFAYRIDLEWWVFALAGLIALIIAFITVSFQSTRAALSNPVEALKTE